MNQTDLKQDLELLSKSLKEYSFSENLEQVNQVIKDLAEPFKLMIVGEGKFGKSTLINALLGRSDGIAEVGRIPKTWTVDIYHSNSSNEKAEIFFNDAKVLEKSISEAKSMISDAEKNKDNNEKYVEKSKIYQIKWHIKSEWPINNIDLVDTPGFAQIKSSDKIGKINLFGGRGIELQTSDDAFWYYYYRADLVLWCIRADRLQDADTLKMVAEATEQKKLIIGVITYSDKIPQDRENSVMEEIEKLYGKYLESVVFFAGVGSQTASLTKKLRETIDGKFAEKLEQIKMQAKIAFIKNQKLFLSKSIYKIFECVESNLAKYLSITQRFKSLSDKTIPTQLAQLKEILKKEKEKSLQKIPAFYDAVSGNSEAFAAKIKNEAINFRSLESGITSVYEKFEGLVNAEMASSSRDLSWVGVSIGEKEVKQYTVSIYFGGNSMQRNSPDVSVTIDSFDGIGSGLVAGSIAAYAGSILLGPIGLIAGGIGFLVSMFTKRNKHIDSGNNAIIKTFEGLEKEYTERFSQKMSSVFYTITSSVNKSFEQHHGMGHEQIQRLSKRFDETYNSLDLFDKISADYSYDINDMSKKTIFAHRLIKFKSDEKIDWDRKVESFIHKEIDRSLAKYYSNVQDWKSDKLWLIRSGNISSTNLEASEIPGYAKVSAKNYKLLQYFTEERLDKIKHLLFSDGRKVLPYFESEFINFANSYLDYVSFTVQNVREKWHSYVNNIIDTMITEAFTLSQQEVDKWSADCKKLISNSDLGKSNLDYTEIANYPNYINPLYRGHIYFTQARLQSLQVLKYFFNKTHIAELNDRYYLAYNSFMSKVFLEQKKLREQWDITILDKFKSVMVESISASWNEGKNAPYSQKVLRKKIRRMTKSLIPGIKQTVTYNDGAASNIHYAHYLFRTDVVEQIKSFLDYTDEAFEEAKNKHGHYKIFHVNDLQNFFRQAYDKNITSLINAKIWKCGYSTKAFPYIKGKVVWAFALLPVLAIGGVPGDVILYLFLGGLALLYFIFIGIRISFNYKLRKEMKRILHEILVEINLEKEKVMEYYYAKS